jgi:Gpi18-like mannosyltransferase
VKNNKTSGNNLSGKLASVMRYISKNELLLAIISALIIVCLTVGLGLQRDKITTPNPWVPSHYLSEPNNHLSFLASWDANGYISIAKHGYTPPLTNYFPLYPLLIHIANKVISSPLYSALLVSWASLVGAIYFYIKIIKRFFKISVNKEALKGVAIFLLYPTGIFLIASYTESVFAFVSLAAIYFALKKRYLLSGLFALFATAAHINGLLSLLLVMMILYEEREKLINIFQTFVIGMLGILSYMFYLRVKFHNALEFLTEQRKIHGWLQHSLLSELSHINPLEYLFACLIIMTVIYWWPRRKSFAIYSGIYLLIPIIGGTIGGFTRYTLMVFPLQFMLFDVFRKRQLGYALVLAILAIGWAFFTIGFSAGYIG